MDYIELEIDSTLATQSIGSLSPKDTPLVYIGRTLQNIVGAKILEVNIPFSYYVISDRIAISNSSIQENMLQLTWSGSEAYPIFIPPGNYTGPSLAAVIQTGLQAAIAFIAVPPHSFNGPLRSASCVFNTASGTFTMTINQDPVGLTAANADRLEFFYSEELGKVLGIVGATNMIALWTPRPAVSATYSFITTNVANITGPNNLYVNSVLLGNLCKAYLPQSSLVTGETNPQMAMVPVNVNPGGVIWWQDPAPQEVFDTKNLFSLNQLDFYITAGTDTRPLQFNGLGFQIKVLLFVRYPETGMGQAGTVGQGRAIMRIQPN